MKPSDIHAVHNQDTVKHVHPKKAPPPSNKGVSFSDAYKAIDQTKPRQEESKGLRVIFAELRNTIQYAYSRMTQITRQHYLSKLYYPN